MPDATDTARRLASSHPDALLPCPRCAAAVKGANLQRHLTRSHPGDEASRASWRGPERLIARPIFALPTIAFLAAVSWAVATDPEDDAIVLVTGFAFALGWIVGGAVLAGVPLFRGRLLLRDDTAVLRHTLGLRHRRLIHVDGVEVGPAFERRPTGSSAGDLDTHASVEERAGTYLRLRDGRRHITVRCRQGTPLRRSWAGWRQGRRTRRWHLTLGVADFVALQYALAERGLLTVA